MRSRKTHSAADPAHVNRSTRGGLEPPAYFDAGHVQVWHEICGQCPPGVLASSDRAILELTVRLLVRMRRSPAVRPNWLGKLGDVLAGFGWKARAVEEFQDTVFQAIRITPGELRVLTGCLGNLGMTPLRRIPGRAATEELDPLDTLLGKLTRVA